MSLTRTLAATSLCFSMSQALFADTRLSIQHTEPGEQPRIQTVMVTSGKVRMEQGTNDDDDTLMLYHQANNTFFVIQPDEKSYMELDPEKTGEMMDQASQMQQQMMAQLQESLKEMPEEQREQMMKMMNRSGKMMQGLPPGLPEEPVRYEPRGGSDSIGGFACKWVEVYQGERKVRELCLADSSAIGMPSGDKDTMMAMQSSMKALAKRMGSAGMFQDDMPDGFPVHVRHFGSNGQVTSEQQVQDVSHDKLDSSLFEIPAGYQKRELPTLPPQ